MHDHAPAQPLPVARRLRRAAERDRVPWDVVTLDYDGRLIRRKRLETAHGAAFLVDLASTVGVEQGDCFELEDGRLVEVIAAEEELVAVTGDLPRLAWHIGNRHTPCQIEADRLLIRRDHVLEAMLRGLGAAIVPVSEPFGPEGGAYGHGRPMGHDHGHDHDHDHGHDHGHGHGHTGRHGHGGDHGHDHGQDHAGHDRGHPQRRGG